MEGLIGTPARSSTVGARSTVRASPSGRNPAGILGGYRIRSGFRIDSSYGSRRSVVRPCSPKKKPLSLLRTRTVLSSSFRESSVAMIRPRLSSMARIISARRRMVSSPVQGYAACSCSPGRGAAASRQIRKGVADGWLSCQIRRDLRWQLASRENPVAVTTFMSRRRDVAAIALRVERAVVTLHDVRMDRLVREIQQERRPCSRWINDTARSVRRSVMYPGTLCRAPSSNSSGSVERPWPGMAAQ